MSTQAVEPVRPDREDVTAAEEALPHIQDYLTSHPEAHLIRVRVDDTQGKDVLTVPRAAVELLAQVLAHMAKGQGVSIVPADAELTTQQAADLLNVSRPYLISLLVAGQIEYRLVGSHRRIRAASLLHYIRADDQRRRESADELTALNHDMGLL